MVNQIKLSLALLILTTLLTGCYGMRPEMYQARTAYYNAQVAAYQAQSAQAQQPLLSMTTTDGSKVSVANPIPVALPVVQQERNGWVDFGKTIINSTPLSILAGGWSASKLLKYSTGDVNINGDGNTASPISNSYNTKTTDIASTGDDSTLDQHADSSDNSSVDKSDSSDNSNNSDNSDNSSVDNSDNRTDYDNQTATPTIVEQPAPVIVDPVIVNPKVVNPVVLNNN